MVSQLNSNLSIFIVLKIKLVLILAPLALSQGSGTLQVVSEQGCNTAVVGPFARLQVTM